MILPLKFSKGRISIKMKMELQIFISAHRLIMLYMCTKLSKISQRVLNLLRGHNDLTHIIKGA